MEKSVATDPSTAGKRVVIFANPHAGRASARELPHELSDALRAHQFDAVVCQDRDQFSELVQPSKSLCCIVAAGGDGTFNEVLNRAPDVPLAVLPIGNENLVAKHFGFPRSAGRLAQIIADGRIERIDVGVINGRKFALMASAGFDADVVHRVHQNRRGHVSKRTYAWQMILAADNYRFPIIDVEIVDTGERLRGALVSVSNMPEYGLGIPIAPGADPSDGRLDLYVFQRPGIANLMRYAISVLMRRHGQRRDVQHRRVRRVRLCAGPRVPVQADGDPAGFLPASIEVLPHAVGIVTP